ncbi:MAG: hypothetical protein D8B55_07240 [Actinomyces sp.]|nr:MAG: hypothetical protein D8B55_07240 [Actinomyces sp.]
MRVRFPFRPLLPVTHTRAGFTQHVVAHKGLIPPLCAARCLLIPALVCDTGEGRAPRRDEGRNLGERNGWVSREPRLPRARTLLDTHGGSQVGSPQRA